MTSFGLNDKIYSLNMMSKQNRGKASNPLSFRSSRRKPHFTLCCEEGTCRFHLGSKTPGALARSSERRARNSKRILNKKKKEVCMSDKEH